MDLSKSRQSKNVIDGRRVSTAIRLNERSMSSTKLKDKAPLSRQRGDVTDLVTSVAKNPGNRKTAAKPVGSRRTFKDPAPQKLKPVAAKKSGRGGPSRPQRKNRSYEGPK
jgi:hypothetical protein